MTLNDVTAAPFMGEVSRYLKNPTINGAAVVIGLIKVNQEMAISRFKPGIQLLISRFFIFRSAPGFQI